MNGTDYTLYLVFLRYMAYLCGCYSILNFFLMIPIYASGKPDDTEVMDNNTDSIMDFLTVLNITASEGKMIFTYLIALFVIPGMAVYMYISSFVASLQVYSCSSVGVLACMCVRPP